MRFFFLTGFELNGIKSLDEDIKLSFYKKTVDKNGDMSKYNIKAIYGINGAGKSGIVVCARILKNLILDNGYLYNPLVQEKLHELVNKKKKALDIAVEYLVKTSEYITQFRYEVGIKEESDGFCVAYERLYFKNALNSRASFEMLYESINGELKYIYDKNDEIFRNELKEKTANVLFMSTVVSTFYRRIDQFTMTHNPDYSDENAYELYYGLYFLWFLARYIKVYTEKSDEHTDYFLQQKLQSGGDNSEAAKIFIGNLKSLNKTDASIMLSEGRMTIKRENYDTFENEVKGLERFLHVFKNDLEGIDIDKRENGDSYTCSLVMKYEGYDVDAEFESTGIKKLIKLYPYLKRASKGDIVFIDELDANLHDVYLCALLEYFMKYGEGQFIFTSHNVDSMNVLKNNKKSIDFLSVNHKIYSWTNNGNYSASKLYKEGMIEGSPFNIDAIDFLGVFEDAEGED